MLGTFLQALITGILIGGIYAIMSSGLGLIFGVMNIGNAAQAAFAVLAAYIAYWLYVIYGIDPFIGMLISAFTLFVIGIPLYKYIVSRVSELMAFTLLFLLGMFIENCMVFFWTNLYRGISIPYLSYSLEVFGLYIPLDRLVGFIIAVGGILMLAYFLKNSYLGKAIRATMQNPTAASLMGINVDRIYLFTFGIGLMLSGIAGVILGIIYPFYPTLASIWIGLMFAIVVFGGMGSLAGTLLASLIMGIATSLVGTYGSSTWAPLVAYVILIVTLWIKPSGLMGRA